MFFMSIEDTKKVWGEPQLLGWHTLTLVACLSRINIVMMNATNHCN
jgi:hypothetical protein